MSDEKIQVEISLIDSMSQEIRAIRSNMETNFNAANKKLAESKGAFSDLGNEIKNNFTSAIKGAVLGLASFAVIGKTTSFLKLAREEAKQSVLVHNQLKMALGYTSEALNKQAEVIGKKLKIDDDEVTAVQAKLSAYVKDEEQIRRLIPAIMDLGAYIGDNVTAAQQIGRAISDDGAELGRYKIKVEGAADSSQRIDSLISGVNDRLNGQATALANSKDKVDEYKTAWDQFAEKIGKRLLGEGKTVQEIHIDMVKTLQAQLQAEKDRYGRLAPGAEAELKKYNDEIRGFQAAEDKKIADARSKTKQDAIDKENAEARKWAIESLKLTKEGQLKVLQFEMDEKLKTVTAGGLAEFNLRKYYAAKIKALTVEIENDNKKNIPQVYTVSGADATGAVDIYNKKLEAEKAFAQNKLYINTVMQDELNRSSEESFKAWVKQEKQKAEMEKQQKQQAVSFALGTAASIFAGQKKYLALYKTFAISQALMDTYAAANTALKGAPPPFNFIMAGATVAAGLLNVQKIAAQKFATGTAFAPGGLSLINEQGGEYVNLPRGAQVFNNTQTRNMTTSTALTVNITDSSGNITETVRAQLRSGQGDQLVRDLQAKMARLL